MVDNPNNSSLYPIDKKLNFAITSVVKSWADLSVLLRVTIIYFITEAMLTKPKILPLSAVFAVKKGKLSIILQQTAPAFVSLIFITFSLIPASGMAHGQSVKSLTSPTSQHPAALGGNFDPALHLEIQRDMEDLIEAEQVNADSQPGRRHSPSHPVHVLSESDMSEASITNTQEDDQRHHIQMTRQIHPPSSSSDDSLAEPQLSDVRGPLGPEAGSGVTDSSVTSPSGPPPSSFLRSRTDYTTLNITDDEYLNNSTADEDDVDE